jgi:glycosyltransferase involved in cell wall biosynthesis
VTVLWNDENQGVGGAVIAGYRRALEDGMEVMVKIDGDGQMDPLDIPSFVQPILSGRADYTKGNRFFHPENVLRMPRIRLIGNAALSFMTKLSSGYWNVFDPTNGFTAIHASVVRELPLDKISRRYFFESDMLFRLSTIRAVVVDIPVDARYGSEVSSMVIGKVVFEFLARHGTNFLKRIAYSYFLRDFNIATLELCFGLVSLLLGMVFGGYEWIQNAQRGVPATSGTVMLAALPILVGLQLVLAFLNYDIQSVPRSPLVAERVEEGPVPPA